MPDPSVLRQRWWPPPPLECELLLDELPCELLLDELLACELLLLDEPPVCEGGVDACDGGEDGGLLRTGGWYVRTGGW